MKLLQELYNLFFPIPGIHNVSVRLIIAKQGFSVDGFHGPKIL
jgi:hypothetical protein